ncbi:hypothetical protein [Aneurinibacillus terranovensis]|uniref:hypothetical protein n=1 Tax=Aneurinibacillus terranovensis TaxID=278991 RepID=UPI00040779FC|nr:hypothetical protein [Aneurinibacillus terranovensis]
MLQKLRKLINKPSQAGNDWAVVFFDKNDFRLDAMKKRLADHGIQSHIVKSEAVYVQANDLQAAKTIVAEWVNH